MNTAADHLARLINNRLGAAFPRGPAEARGDARHPFVVRRAHLLEFISFLRNDRDADLSLLIDITGVDRGGPVLGDDKHRRFEVWYQLRSPRLGYRAHIAVPIAEDDAVVPSLTPLFRAAETLERELFEMFGIYPDGHPQLLPYLLYKGFVGHPLRKDYRAGKQQPLVPLLDDVAQPVIIDADIAGEGGAA